MDAEKYQPHFAKFHWSANASLETLMASNSLSVSITSIMIILVNAYLADVNANTRLATAQENITKSIMEGDYSGPFDDNDKDNDPQVWGNSKADSDDINEDQTIVSNSNAWFKMEDGTNQAAASSGSSFLSSTQQNQKQLFSFMNGANGTQDYVGSLVASSLL